MKKKTIIFTGGGSAGHVTPNVALIQQLQREVWDIHYIGSSKGVEKEINLRNLLSPLQVLAGVISSFFLCQKIKPSVIFSKGGFVAFPVVFAGWLSRIPVIVHESDITPGLANKMSFPFCRKICVTFPEGLASFGYAAKVVCTGAPVRENLFKGDKERGLSLCGFNHHKPVLMIVGGGLGAEVINRLVRQILLTLLGKFQVVHLCGKGKTVDNIHHEGYRQFDYVDEAMPDIYACADIVVSRAGSNAIYELLLLKKLHLLIPLSYKASRGDQVLNAAYYEKQRVSMVLPEEEMTPETLWEKINALYEDDAMRRRLAAFELPNGVDAILEMLRSA
ncbi:MAG: undecaprenyldiphospho-muramoylpentapeptide beta-N-acetylglucosaminyltransferase [Gammaproteobacteria bacterium]|nr:undecaprenyldiphospho-muramoylpentapeptide beta-N-acetylglucosaminyltransferase [Gammaproteobacteria bacterium]